MSVFNLALSGSKSTLLMLTLMCASALSAHEMRPAIADVTMGADRIGIELRLTAETLLAGIDQSLYSDTDDAPQAEDYDALRAMSPVDLSAAFAAGWPRLAKGFLSQGLGPLTLEGVSVEDPGDLELPRDTTVRLSAPYEDGAIAIQFGWVAQNGPVVVRMGSGDDAYAAFLDGGDLSAELPRVGAVDESAGQVFLRYVIEGFDHIIPKGIDHILFVLGLFFFSLHWRPLLWQVTAFTLAHTVTLALATLGVIAIPAASMWLVEALIAISITYVAVENIVRPKLGWWRTAVVFAFGLLHGLGFASVLGDLGLNQGQFGLSLIAFNIGVEIGQLTVIAVAFGLLALPFGRQAWYRMAIVIPGSLAIAAVGLYWFIERAFW